MGTETNGGSDAVDINEELSESTSLGEDLSSEEKNHTTISSGSNLTSPKTSNSSGGGSAIPIIAGVGAAVAAGAGAKIYLDNKKNTDNESYDGNYDEDGSEDTIVDNNDTMVQDSDNSIEEDFAEPVKYSARSTEELDEKLGGYNG